MSKYIRSRIRLRRQPQSQSCKCWILRPLTLKFLLLQLLVVTPTQNIYTGSNPTTKVSAFTERTTVTATAEETTEPLTRAEQNGDDTKYNTSVPLESLDVKNTDTKSPSGKRVVLNTSRKSSGDSRKTSTLSRGRPQRNEARLTRTRGYVENNLTSTRSNFSNIDSLNGSLKAAVGLEVEGNGAKTNTTTTTTTTTTTADTAQIWTDSTAVSKRDKGNNINVSDIWIEDLAQINKSNISITAARGISLLRTKLHRNSSYEQTDPGIKQVPVNSDTTNEDIVFLGTPHPSSVTNKSDSDLSNSYKEHSAAEHTRVAHTSTNFTSCVERCGDDTSFPCSCNEKCLVHKNCCEDMVDACPRLYRQAENTFGHLVNAQIRCEPTTVVFMVESCPTNSHEAGVTVESTVLQGSPMFTASQDPSDMKDNLRTTDVLSRLVANAPVTDYITGIIYANASIFHCNQQTDNLNTYQSINSRTIHWNVQTEPREDWVLNTLNGFSEAIDPSAFSYIPPPGQPASAGSLCYTNETSSCIYEISADLGVRPIVCNLSVNRYYSIRKTVGFISGSSALSICAYCLSRHQTTSLGDWRSFSSGLKVLMSLSDTPGRVVYALDQTSKHRGQSLPWLSWTCDVQEDIVDQRADTPCQALECSDEYYVTPEGTCGKIVNVEFALQNDFLLNGKMCRIEPDVLAEFSYCYLRELLDLEATDTPYRSSKVSEDNLNLSMTTIRMEMYAITNTDHLEQKTLEDTLPQAMLLFVRHHCSLAREDMGGKGQLPYSKSLSSQKRKTSDSHDINMTLSRNFKLRTTEPMNIPDIPSTIVFTFCFEGKKPHRFLPNVIQCIFSGEFSLAPASTIKTGRFVDVAKIADEKCLKTDIAKYVSGGRKVNFNFSLNYLIVIATFLGWLEDNLG